MIPQIKLKYILFLLISFSFIKTQKNIELKNGYYSDIFNQTESFNVKNIDDASYLKIKAEGKDTKEKINHIISYYKDQELKERQQLSQSISDTSIMWLNKKQIEKDFYITIECAKSPCKYNLSLNGTDSAELDVNEQYTYYVSDNNEEMNFKINPFTEDKTFENPSIRIWVKGNFKIKAEFNENKVENNNYHFFDIEYNEFVKSENKLTITGKVGDLINIGISFVNKEDNNVYDFPFLKIEEGLEVTNYLNPKESHKFDTTAFDDSFLGYHFDLNNKIRSFSREETFNPTDEKKNYSIHFLSTTKYDGQGNNKYSPLLNGIYYLKILEEGTSIGLIPMKPEDNFNFLTYEIFPNDGNISVSIYKCDNYPLCHTDDKILEKSEKIKDYQSFYYVYSKDEWGNEITPISKKQNMLIINCKNGLKIDEEKDARFCLTYINMKTNNTPKFYNDFFKEVLPYRRFIRKDNEDFYFLKGNEKQEMYLNIETFTGEIKIELESSNNNYFKNEFGNKKLYVFPKNTNIKLKITGLTNSVYSISDNYYIKEHLKIGSNYLLSLKEESEMTIIPKDQATYPKTNDLYYLGIYSLNCSLYLDGKDNKIDKNGFYQVIERTSSEKKLSIIKGEENSNDNCLFYVSSHKLEEFSSNSNGIPLGNNTSQSFKFSKEHNSMIFSFPHTEIENDIKIDFKTEGKYKAKIMVDGKNIKEDNINSNKVIQLNASDLKENCEDFKFICKILIHLESEEKDKESTIEISINSINEEGSDENQSDNPSDNPSDENQSDNPSDNPSDENKSDNNKEEEEEDDDDDDDNDKVLIIIFSILGVVIVIAIAGGLYYYFKVSSKNRDLSQAVNQISFKDDDKDREDIGDSLLD